MVNANTKTPNKKRKSMGGDSQAAQSPKGGKKGNATPGKFNKSPKPSPQQNAKTPKQTPFKNQNRPIGDSPGQTPFKRGNANNSAAKPFKKQVETPVQKTKRSSESENETSPPKKMKMFTGTSDLDAKPQKKQAKQQKNQGEAQSGKKGKRKSQFYKLKDLAQKGDKEVVEKIEAKIQDMLKVKAPTKTAKRKLKFLEKLKRIAKGEKVAAAPQPQKAKAKDAKVKQDQKKQAKVEKPKKDDAIQFADDDEESDSSESDYEVDAEIKPDKIIKTGELEAEEEESDDDEEEEGDEEEDDDDDDDDEEDEDESDEEEVPQLIKVPQGGKKKGEEKKNEVKAKNFKLQAMRKQGQLAGSVKQNQKRSARRNKQNAKPVNGGN